MPAQPFPIRSVLRTGFIVGCLDAIAASVYSYALSGVMPDRVFRYVASGVFGAEAFRGGWGTAAMGLLFHFIVATGWTAIFYFLYARVNLASMNKCVVGIGYGIVIWLMMNFLVVPISNVPPSAFHFTWRSMIMIAIHMFVIGVPISYLTGRHYSQQAK